MYFSPLLVPYDGSAAADKAVRYVAENFRDPAVEVRLVNVQRPILEDDALRHVAPLIAREARAEGEKILAPAAAVLEEAGVRHAVEVGFGDPAETLVRIAVARGARLIVVGAKQRRTLVDLVRSS